MKRKEILTEVKATCISEYAQIESWFHGIDHIEMVVENGRKLAEMEKLRSKEAFLLELACWLHDIGRIGEPTGLTAAQSSHAEHSYLKSKLILKPYERPLGRESVFKILQAVREHSLPVLKHPDNQINCLLLDADRGGNLDIRGIFRVLNYMKMITTEPILTVEQAREKLDWLFKELKESRQKEKAIDQLEVLRDWYYGNPRQKVSGKKVMPLCSKSAKKLYKAGIREIEVFIERLSR